MAGEGDALLLNLTKLSKGKYLKAAAVGQNRAVPAGECVNAAQLPHQLVSGAHMEVIGITQLYLAVQVSQVVSGNGALDGTAGRHIHKRRRLNHAMHSREFTAPGTFLLREDF